MPIQVAQCVMGESGWAVAPIFRRISPAASRPAHAPSFRYAFALAESFRLKPGRVWSKVSIVGKLRKGFVVARRIEPSNDVLHDEIPDGGPVPHVEIERHQFLLEVQFRIVAKAGARIEIGRASC